MPHAVSTPELLLAVGTILTPLLIILGALWRLNNNVVKWNVALDGAVGDISDIKEVQTVHGNKISELIGSVNARAKVTERIEPLTYKATS